MRRFVQPFVLIVGFAVAIAAVKAEQSKPSIGNCFEIAPANAPAICN